ncbi:MAG TPA: ATP-dependent DNA helicase RecQ [Anaeromyxobacteraceae bacterium]|nr:ATP-dependent DNA helicase RecQ [Anaeromyxobacteraceae bacterium]
MPPPPQDNPLFESVARRRALRAEIEALSADWTGADPSDRALATRLEAALTRLRVEYRRAPGAFGPQEIAELRRLSHALRRAGKPDPTAVLRDVFGHEAFRPGQQAIIDAVLAGNDCIGVMPTGAGKSLTYQIPARVIGGTTLVVSPLIALMKDQVDAMARVGVRATFLNSSVDPDERRSRIERLRRGELELVYAAPEGIEASVGSALQGQRLTAIAVDEAHCISHWGHDFRPAYRNLKDLKRRFGDIPVLALTATATPQVTHDIAEQLGMRAPVLVRGTFFRPNLHVHAYKKGEGGDGGARSGIRSRDALLRLVRARPGQSGIVYCLARKTADGTAELLRDHGVRAAAYHAGLDSDRRAKVQDAFQAGGVDVVVATVAFGMGIDKPDIRYVIHRDMPRSVEGYYQEIGRAGRDGGASDCVLFYSWADVCGWDRLAEGADQAVAAWQKRQAREMYRLAENAACRHQSLVGHFGEVIAPCGSSCDLCSGADLLAATSAPRSARASTRTAAPRRRRRSTRRS